MKKRVLQCIVIILVILGYNLLCQGEVLAKMRYAEINTGLTKIKYKLDFREEGKPVKYDTFWADIDIIKKEWSGQEYKKTDGKTYRDAIVTFKTYGQNAMTIYYGYKMDDWQVDEGEDGKGTTEIHVRGPADAVWQARRLQEKVNHVQQVLEGEYAGEIDKDGQNKEFYDYSRRAVFPGKTYDYDLNLSDIEMGDEYSVKVKAGGKNLHRDENTNKYKLVVPKESTDKNYFANNQFKVNVSGYYYNYEAVWTVKVTFCKEGGKWYTETAKGSDSKDYIYVIDTNNDSGDQVCEELGASEKRRFKFKAAKADRNKVTKNNPISPSFNLLADVTVNQWIQNVSLQTRDEFKTIDANNKEVMDYSKYRTTEGAMEYVDTNGNQSQNIENNNRKNLTELQKQQNKVLLENGQYFKYKVRVENHNISAPVYVRLQAEVEGSCDPKRISWKDSLGQERMLS